jgi:hypothetical protein
MFSLIVDREDERRGVVLPVVTFVPGSFGEATEYPACCSLHDGHCCTFVNRFFIEFSYTEAVYSCLIESCSFRVSKNTFCEERNNKGSLRIRR